MGLVIEEKMEISGGGIIKVTFELPVPLESLVDLTKDTYAPIAKQLAGYLAILQLSEKEEVAVGIGILKMHLAQAAKETMHIIQATKKLKRKKSRSKTK